MESLQNWLKRRNAYEKIPVEKAPPLQPQPKQPEQIEISYEDKVIIHNLLQARDGETVVKSAKVAANEILRVIQNQNNTDSLKDLADRPWLMEKWNQIVLNIPKGDKERAYVDRLRQLIMKWLPNNNTQVAVHKKFHVMFDSLADPMSMNMAYDDLLRSLKKWEQESGLFVEDIMADAGRSYANGRRMATMGVSSENALESTPVLNLEYEPEERPRPSRRVTSENALESKPVPDLIDLEYEPEERPRPSRRVTYNSAIRPVRSQTVLPRRQTAS
jgi:hypothetical protein